MRNFTATTLIVFLIVCGCSRESTKNELPSPANSVPARGTPHVLDGVRFESPIGWSSERVAENNGLLLMAPVIEDQWQTNAFFEVRSDLNNQARNLTQVLDDLIPNLKTQKSKFALKEKEVLSHANNFQYGRIWYTAEKEETPLEEWEIVVPLGNGKYLFALMSAAQSEWPEYEAEFIKIIDSIRVGENKS